MNELNSVLSGTERCEPPSQCMSPSLLDGLKRRQRQLSSSLADVNAAVEALEGSPEVAKVLELVARVRN